MESYPAFRARCVDALAGAVHAQLAASIVKLPDHDPSFEARANRFDLPNSSLWFCAYGTPVAIRFPEADHVRIQFRHAGIGASWVGEELVPVTESQACVSGAEVEFDFAADFEQLVWRVPKGFLVQKLSALTGAPVLCALDFAPALTLSTPRATLLRRILDCIVSAAGQATVGAMKTALGELEQAMVTALLTAGQHSCRDRLEQESPGAAPWQVRRAESYIEANWQTPVTMEVLASVTGASARSIFRAFQQSRGYTPLEFARRIRLQHARRMLQDSGTHGSVTEVAFACGFSDLGRFSKDYAQAFGERPSAVLNRRKAAGRMRA